MSVGDVPKLDDRDEQILAFIIRNPDATVEEIAAETNIPGSTVQKRLSDLLKDRVLARQIVVQNWQLAGYSLSYRIDIKINQRVLRSGHGGLEEDGNQINSQKKLASYIRDRLSKRYSNQLIVRDVVILLGQQADLVVSVRAKDHAVILDFVTEALRMCGGVDYTMTSQEAWSCADGDNFTPVASSR